MKRILMIAFHYPPLRGSSGIQRTLAFSRDLREHGWEPIVLSAHPRAYERVGDDQMQDIPEGVPVYRPFALDASRHLSIRGAYPTALSLPDRWSSWCVGAIPCGLWLLRRYRPDVLWSTFPIASAHVIGRWLHSASGIPWVADCRDSMTEPGYPRVPAVRRAYVRIERATVEHATRTVFTTPGALRMYAERYPRIPRDRFAVIENGYDEEKVREAEERVRDRAPEEGRPTTLVHSGVLYPEERDPRAFFAALGALRAEGKISGSSLRIVLRAPGHDEYHRTLLRAEGIEDIVRLEPPVGYTDALGEMSAADGLLILQASSCNHQIPAKLYEYLRVRRPIFAMTDAAGDTARVLVDAGIDTIVPLPSKEQIASGLLAFLDSLRRGTAPLPREEAVARHSRRRRAAELAVLLEAVSAERRAAGSHGSGR